jgi:hypothetical protein
MRCIPRPPRMTAGLLVLAACVTAPPATTADGSPPGEFAPTHHALVEGVVTSLAGQPLDSVTVVAWRLAEGQGSVAQERVVTDAAGRFRLPVRVTVGPQPAPQSARAVIRGFAYASRYPRGPEGRVAMDSASVPITLVPLGQAPRSAEARITLPLP